MRHFFFVLSAFLYVVSLQYGVSVATELVLPTDAMSAQHKNVVLHDPIGNDVTVMTGSNGVMELKHICTTTPTVREEVRQLLGDADSILFIRRKTFQSSHYYTDFIDGCVYFGSDLCILSLKDGSVQNILPESMTDGIVSRCNLSYDGKKVIFDYKAKIGEGFRIWEIGIDGHNLRQLTFPPADEAARIEKYRQHWHTMYHHHTDDMHPCYLPDGGFCFVSTRCEFGILCDGPDILTTSVLYRANADGSLIEKLSNNSVSESSPTVMSDGRILYTRWEYIDNGAVTNKGLWAVHPDGTASTEVYGTNIAFPSVFYVARPIPGSNDLFVSIGAPHMPLGVGTIMLIDTRLNRRTGDPVTYITPEVDVRHQLCWDAVPGGATKPFQPEGLIHTKKTNDGLGNTDRGPLFMDPFPIDANQFLVSYNPDQLWSAVDAYGLYLIDGKGSRKLLHLESGTSCWSPIPIRARKPEPISSGTIDPELAKQGLAQAVVTDIYRGLDGVERGTIKYIRINEHVPRPWAARRFWGNSTGKGNTDDCFDQQHSVITLETHLGLKLQDGIVPVEEDGSANFLVRADKNIFFQVLDENFMEVQRERTFINFRPGEIRSCVGCHEQASEAPKADAVPPLALKRPPRLPGPQPGEKSGARPIHYPTDVQPVLDRHCISCHSGDQPQGDIVLTGEMTRYFNRSYEELISRNLFPVIRENNPKAGNNHYLPPYILGSHASPLVKRIIDPKSPCYTDMSLEYRIRITTWVDSNGQYYGTYLGKKNLNFQGEDDFRPVPTYEESANTDVASAQSTTSWPKGSEAGERRVWTNAGVEFAFRWCPAGTFIMGSPESEEDRATGKETQRPVTLTQGFWMLETEVTQAMWASIMKNNPSNFKGKLLPVENVSWEDCQEFITKLNALQQVPDFKFSLPTEAQWEYACRAGTTTPYHFGNVFKSSEANYASGKTKEVGSYPANAWGLQDMHGNVWEWCNDWYGAGPAELYAGYVSDAETDPVGPSGGSLRVLRGGGLDAIARYCRSASRDRYDSSFRYGYLGLRLAIVPVNQ